MSEPKKNIKPLDMTSDEAVKFLFPADAIKEMNKVANPHKQKASDQDEECDEQPYSQDSA